MVTMSKRCTNAVTSPAKAELIFQGSLAEGEYAAEFSTGLSDLRSGWCGDSLFGGKRAFSLDDTIFTLGRPNSRYCKWNTGGLQLLSLMRVLLDEVINLSKCFVFWSSVED